MNRPGVGLRGGQHCLTSIGDGKTSTPPCFRRQSLGRPPYLTAPKSGRALVMQRFWLPHRQYKFSNQVEGVGPRTEPTPQYELIASLLQTCIVLVCMCLTSLECTKAREHRAGSGHAAAKQNLTSALESRSGRCTVHRW